MQCLKSKIYLCVSVHFLYFRIVRYEDLSFNTYNVAVDLFNFLQLTAHSGLSSWIESHTTARRGGLSSTFRNSKTTPLRWRTYMDWSQIEDIQSKCSKALKLWGYEEAKDEIHVRSFNPVNNLVL